MKKVIAATLMTMLTITSFYHTNEDSSNSDFERWAKQHGKIYYGDEKTYRQAIYYQNKQMIEEHNKRTDVTYQMGENQFTAYTNEEFINLYLNPRPPQKLNVQDKISRETTPQSPQSPQPNKEQKIKETVDWSGLVKVKNQGNCASSYAMASTSLVEGQFAITKGIKVILSAQNLVDCNYVSSAGCQANSYGNDVHHALSYIDQYGIYTEQYYPYVGKEQSCQVNRYEKGPWTIGWHWIVPTGWFEYELRDHPITTFVDATNWQFYKSGTFSLCSSSYDKANYYALIVGYTDQYWIVQASFGTGWGESGYIRLLPGNTCGIEANEGYKVEVF